MVMFCVKRCNNELYTLYDELGVVKVIKIGRTKWMGQLFRMQELDPCRKLTVLETEGTRRLGKPQLMWLESVEEDLKNTGLRNCRSSRTENSRGQFWGEGKVHRGL